MEYAATIVKLILNISVALTVFAYAMRVKMDDFTFFRRDPRLLLTSLLSIFVLSPTIAISVVEWTSAPLVVRIVIVTLSISIIPPLLPLKQLAAGGNRAYAVGLTLIVAVLTVGVVPLQADLLGRISEHHYGVSPGELAGYVSVIIVIPTLLGVLIAHLLPAVAAKVSYPLGHFAGLVTLGTMVAILIPVLPEIAKLLSFQTLLAMLLFNVLALGVGHLLGGPGIDRAVVLGLSTASRHPALALTVASVNFPGENFTAAVMLGVVVNMVVATPYLRWHRRRKAARDPAPAAGAEA